MHRGFLEVVAGSCCLLALACGASSRTEGDDGSTRGGSSNAGSSSVGGTGGDSPVDCGSDACFIGGTCYTNGVTGVPAGDGCNTCSCEEGRALCTREPCETNGKPCVANSMEYPSGSLVPVDCNSCLCIDGELRACTEGLCPPTYRCRSSRDCPDGRVCVAPSCGEDGRCVERRGDCPITEEPVCDCNGITQTGPCSAQQYAKAVAHPGACGERSCSVDGRIQENRTYWDGPDACSSCSCIDGSVICSSRACVECSEPSDIACADDEYCYFTSDTCGSDGPGHCELRPLGNCQLEASAVCGCDGNFYINYCYAAAAGFSIGHCSADP